MAGGLIKATLGIGSQFPRLAGLGSKLLGVARPAANVIRTNPIRTLTGVGAAKGFLDEGFGGIIPGAIQGGFIGSGLGALGPMGGLTRGLAARGVAPNVANAITKVGVPLAAGAYTWGSSGGSGGNRPPGNVGGPIADAAGGVMNTGQNVGAGFLVQNLATGEQFLTGPQNALPGGMGQYGYIPPIGTQADQVDPTGPFSGRRIGTRLDARANAAALNILMPTIRKYAETRAKDELTRQLAAAGVRQNIATNALLTEISARKDAEMGRKAAEQAGNAVTQNYATYQ